MKSFGPMIGIHTIEGSLDLAGDLRARGAGLRALAAGLNGQISLTVRDGVLNNQYLEPLARDLVGALLKGKQNKTAARLVCFANSYDIKDGIAVSQLLLLDTENLTLVGDGQINLANEAIRYHLIPRSKNPSLLSLATPINVGGSLARPTFMPDNVVITSSLAKAAVGNVLLPGFGLLLPLLNAGAGEVRPCLNVLQDAGK